MKKGELFLADVSVHLKRKDITCDVKVDSNSNAEVQYLHDCAGFSISTGLPYWPENYIYNISAVVGTSTASIGADVAFDLRTSIYSKFNAGLCFSNSDLVAALTLCRGQPQVFNQ